MPVSVVKNEGQREGEPRPASRSSRRTKTLTVTGASERNFRKAIKEKKTSNNWGVKGKGEVELTSQFYSSKEPGTV